MSLFNRNAKNKKVVENDSKVKIETKTDNKVYDNYQPRDLEGDPTGLPIYRIEKNKLNHNIDYNDKLNFEFSVEKSYQVDDEKSEDAYGKIDFSFAAKDKDSGDFSRFRIKAEGATLRGDKDLIHLSAAFIDELKKLSTDEKEWDKFKNTSNNHYATVGGLKLYCEATDFENPGKYTPKDDNNEVRLERTLALLKLLEITNDDILRAHERIAEADKSVAREEEIVKQKAAKPALNILKELNISKR